MKKPVQTLTPPFHSSLTRSFVSAVELAFTTAKAVGVESAANKIVFLNIFIRLLGTHATSLSFF